MRAIDADDLAKKVAYSREIPANVVCDVIELIESAPTIEAPKRNCEQCEHHKPNATGVYGCELWQCIKI